MSLYDCIFGPSLYRIYGIPNRNYEPYNLERYTDLIIRFVQVCRTALTYGSPLLTYYLIQNRLADNETSFFSFVARSTYTRVIMALSSFYIISHLLRGFSRSINPQYCQFIRQFKLASTPLPTDHRDQDQLIKGISDARNTIREKYDFDFSHFPIDFKWWEGVYAKDRPARLLPVTEASNNELLMDGPVGKMLSYLMANSVGRMLLYPGSIGLLQKVLESNLVTGRQFLIENYNAKRYKLLARDQNEIDAIFIDKRQNQPASNLDHHGNTLVITCEGNAGFYEIGTVTTPLHLNYSVLGWNHPGFGDSTGLPFPQNDINAMEVVVNFAVSKLNFKLENILIFAWSIGGFPAAWAVSNYPEIKGIIMDACFDDVLPMARSRMSPFLAPIVDTTIRHYFNLNVSSYLNRYNGPVRFIRRLRDEIIPLDASRPLITNRGNLLLINLLKARFPKLMAHDDCYDEVEQFLMTTNLEYYLHKINDQKVLEALADFVQENNVDSYPIEIDVDDSKNLNMLLAQQIILFMCRETMTQFDSTHCTPLPPSLFKEPFDLFEWISKA